LSPVCSMHSQSSLLQMHFIPELIDRQNTYRKTSFRG
jgi:hypothetical protein